MPFFSLQQRPTGVGVNPAGGMCLTDLRAKNETVGMWNFVQYSGSRPGTSCSIKYVQIGLVPLSGLVVSTTALMFESEDLC